MTQRRKLFVVTAMALSAFLYTAWVGYVRLCCEQVQTNTLVGRSEVQIRRSYGQPDDDRQGYHALALEVPPALPPGPIRTLIFRLCSLLHPEGGTFYVWVTERDGEWICFESCWFADGVQF